MTRRIKRTMALCLGSAACLAMTAGPSSGQPAAPVGGSELAGHGVAVNYPPHGAQALPYIPASAYVVADAGTGQVLAAKDPHGQFGPASTLKVLTAVTLMPVLNPNMTVVASAKAANVTPSKVGLIAGDSYRVSDLFKALLMISANDAAIALADATGSYAKAITMMNAEAHHLQADDTVAKTPNGLNRAGQHTSAYDEALIARQALAVPGLMQDEAIRVTTFPVKPHHKPVTLWNQNTMLETYPGDLGGKIGWTTDTKTTFIGWARRGGHTLIVTMLHMRPLTELVYAAKLLDWGFAMDGRVRPAGYLVRPLSATPTHRKAGAAAVPAATPVRPGSALGSPADPLTVPLAIGLVVALVTVVVAARLSARRQPRARSPR
ncbi:MAG TPA: D-alanyl-D-alanine carboxypeptidase [Streptosporangiaceae bacterium]|nr:D-alanyl-D-alanine carboxypeptidase [Streptosporangiaceae bacterium]